MLDAYETTMLGGADHDCHGRLVGLITSRLASSGQVVQPVLSSRQLWAMKGQSLYRRPPETSCLPHQGPQVLVSSACSIDGNGYRVLRATTAG